METRVLQVCGDRDWAEIWGDMPVSREAKGKHDPPRWCGDVLVPGGAGYGCEQAWGDRECVEEDDTGGILGRESEGVFGLYNAEEVDVVVDWAVPYRHVYAGHTDFAATPEEVRADLDHNACHPCFSFSTCKGEEWVSLTEKALAKLSGSYAAIDSGVMTDGMGLLVSGTGSSYVLHEDLKTASAVWQTLVSYQEQGAIMGPGSILSSPNKGNNTGKGAGEDVSDDGIVLGQAYGIVGVQEEFGERQFLLQNPWGE